jgi:hypothetical protein
MKLLPATLLLAITVARLRAAALLPVTPEEAYQWMCAHRLDWAFFGAPAGSAALAHAGMLGLGDGPLGLRLAFPLFAALASVAAWLLGRALFGPAVGLWAAVGLNALPVFNAAALHAGPAMPALALCLLAAWAFVRAFERGLPWWLLAGLLTALAGQMLYAANALFLGAVLVGVISPRHRTEWRRPGLYLALLLVVVASLPALRWNQIHDWPAAALGTWRTEFTIAWAEAASALGTTLFALAIPAALALVAGFVLLARAARIHARPRLILCLAAPFLLLWLRDTLHGGFSGASLLLAAGILAVGAASAFLESRSLRLAGAAVLILTASVTAFQPPATGDDWQPVAAALGPLLHQAQPGHADPIFLIAPDPDATAALSYHLGQTADGAAHPVFLRESQDLSNQFGLWPRYDDFVETAKAPDEYFQELKAVNPYLGHSALYLTDEAPEDLPQTITSAFGRVTPYATLTLRGNRKLRVYLCEDYQTMPL